VVFDLVRALRLILVSGVLILLMEVVCSWWVSVVFMFIKDRRSDILTA
jgi:hypothetical protein